MDIHRGDLQELTDDEDFLELVELVMEASDELINREDGNDFSDNPVARVSKEHSDWSKNAVKKRTPIYSELQGSSLKGGRKRDNSLKSKLSNLAKSKQDFVRVQQQCLLEESKQKLIHMEQKHQEDLRQKREVHQQKLKMMQEEHNINMSILQLKKQKLIRITIKTT